jgi:phosphatidylglycerol:prolipoprotein diacylglycerol transferase
MLQTLVRIPTDLALWVLWAVVAVGGAMMFIDKLRRLGLKTETLLSAAGTIAMLIVVRFAVPFVADGDSLAIRGYGVMFMLAVLAGGALALHRARQLGVDLDIIYSLATWMFIGGLLGARLLYVYEYRHDFLKPSLGETVLAVLSFTRGGLVVYGALLGGMAAFALHVARNRLPPLALMDILVASMVLGQGIGRIGCLLNGCCYGGVCEEPNLPKITFPWGSPPHHRQVQEGRVFLHGLKLQSDGASPPRIVEVEEGSPAWQAGLRPGAVITGIAHRPSPTHKDISPTRSVKDALEELFAANGQPGYDHLAVYTSSGAPPAQWPVALPLPRPLPVQPAQIYAAINGLLFALFAWYYFPYRRRDGQVFATLLTLFPIARFLEEIVRQDEAQDYFLGMTISQTISVGLFFSSIPMWYFVLRQANARLVTPDDWATYNRRWAEKRRSG